MLRSVLQVSVNISATLALLLFFGANLVIPAWPLLDERS